MVSGLDLAGVDGGPIFGTDTILYNAICRRYVVTDNCQLVCLPAT